MNYRHPLVAAAAAALVLSISIALPQDTVQAAATTDGPPVVTSYLVEIAGVVLDVPIAEVSGLGFTVAVVESTTGETTHTVKTPGPVSYGDVLLGRPVGTDGLSRWADELRVGKFIKRDMTVVLLDKTGSEVLRWNLLDCFPSAHLVEPLAASGAFREVYRMTCDLHEMIAA